MVIILGAGQYGIWISENVCNTQEVTFYDNDRRKWGSQIGKSYVLTLDEFLCSIQIEDNSIVIGGHNETLLYFLRDCKPKCGVYSLEKDKLIKFDLKNLPDFEFNNSSQIGTSNLKKYVARMIELASENRTVAYQHAKEYVEFKKQHISSPEIYSIEFTNMCNLKCPNCPNSSMLFHKGYMSDEVFAQVVKYLPPYKDDTVSVHCMGEPLLHPKFIEYISVLADMGINICISTNGILLDDVLTQKILSILSKTDKSIFYISFHTKKSVENWYRFLKVLSEFPDKGSIIFYGQVLEHNEIEAHNWLREIGIDCPYEHSYIRHISSHSFAGNVGNRKTSYGAIETNNRIKNCYYLRNNRVAVLWDGSIKGCCYDSDATQKVGNIFEFENAYLEQKGYPLCMNCDPDWTTGWQ